MADAIFVKRRKNILPGHAWERRLGSKIPRVMEGHGKE